MRSKPGDSSRSLFRTLHFRKHLECHTTPAVQRFTGLSLPRAVSLHIHFPSKQRQCNGCDTSPVFIANCFRDCERDEHFKRILDKIWKLFLHIPRLWPWSVQRSCHGCMGPGSDMLLPSELGCKRDRYSCSLLQ